MTKFKPKTPDESVNYSKEHPLKDYLYLVAGFMAVIGIGFICLDFLVGSIVNRISLEQEVNWLGSVSTKSLAQKLGDSKEASVEETKLKDLMQNLWLPFSKGESLKFSVAVEKQKVMSATRSSTLQQ